MAVNQENILSYVENLITGICAFEMKEGSFNMTCVYSNEGLCRMLGYDRAEIDKYIKNIRYCVLPEDIPVFDQGLRDCLKADDAVDTMFRTITGKGELRWLYTRCNLYSKTGDTYLIVATVIDVTERKNAEEELKAQAAKMHLIDYDKSESVFDYNVKSDVLVLTYTDDDFAEKEIIIPDYIAKFDPSTIYPKDVEKYLTVFNKLMSGPLSESLRIKSNRFSSNYCDYEITLSSIVGLEGYVTRIVGRFINLDRQDNETNNKTSQEEISRQINMSIRDISMDYLREGMMSDKAWEDSFNCMLKRMRWSFAFLVPSVEDAGASPNIKYYAQEGHEFTFDGDRNARLATAEFEDLFKNVKSLTTIKENEAAGYSHSLQQFMIDNDFSKIVYYPFVKEDKYCGAFVIANPLYEEGDLEYEFLDTQRKEVIQMLNFVDSCKFQIEGDPLETRELMIKLIMLDDMDQYIYLIDYDSHRLLFINKKVMERSGEIKLGNCCFCTMMEGRLEECPDCIFAKLDPGDIHSVVSGEIFNYGLRTWLKASASWFSLGKKQRICMITGTDISDYFIG